MTSERITAGNNKIKVFGGGGKFFDALINFCLGAGNDAEEECHDVEQFVHGEFLSDEVRSVNRPFYTSQSQKHSGDFPELLFCLTLALFMSSRVLGTTPLIC